MHKGNAVVQRARLDHLNSLHLRALLGVATPPPTHHPTPVPPPPASPPAAAPASAVAPPSPARTPVPPPLHPPDVPRIRSAVAAALRAELAALHDNGAGGPLDVAAGGEARLDALLREHASKATRLADFTPMLLPYVATEEAFRRVLRPRAWAGASVEHACGALLAPASTKSKATGYLASAPSDSPAAASNDAGDRGPGASAAARLVSRCAAPLVAVADALRGAGALDAVAAIKAAAVASGLPVRLLMMAVRVAVVGSDVGPPLTAVVSLLGRGRAAERLLDAVRAAASLGGGAGDAS